MDTKTIMPDISKGKLKDGKSFTVEEASRLLKQADQKRGKRIAALGFDPAIEGGEMTIEQFHECVIPSQDTTFYTIEEGKELLGLWKNLREKE